MFRFRTWVAGASVAVALGGLSIGCGAAPASADETTESQLQTPPPETERVVTGKLAKATFRTYDELNTFLVDLVVGVSRAPYERGLTLGVTNNTATHQIEFSLSKPIGTVTFPVPSARGEHVLLLTEVLGSHAGSLTAFCIPYSGLGPPGVKDDLQSADDDASNLANVLDRGDVRNDLVDKFSYHIGLRGMNGD